MATDDHRYGVSNVMHAKVVEVKDRVFPAAYFGKLAGMLDAVLEENGPEVAAAFARRRSSGARRGSLGAAFSRFGTVSGRMEALTHAENVGVSPAQVAQLEC